jgi:hypothetical protein
MKKIFISLIISVLTLNVFAQNTKVVDSPSGTVISNSGGADIPHSSAILDVRSTNKGVLFPRAASDLASPTEGLLYYNTTGHNFRYYNGTAWQQATFGNQWNVNGAKISYSGGNVGIENTNPLYNLDVNGTLHTEGFGYIDGYLSVGGNAIFPNYKIQINDGSLAVHNTSEAKFWTLNYASGIGFRILEDGLNSRMTFENGGNVGIGTTTPDYKLDVAGAIRASGNIQSEGNVSINGTATVNNGKGVVYNANSSTNLKIHTFTTETATAVLGPHARSGEFAIGFGGGFTSTPKVFVGDIYSTGGTVGELYMVSLELYGCDTNSCKARLVNHSDGSVNYSIRWNCMAIGN